MNSEQNQIGRKVAAGAAAMIALRFALRGLGLISTLILVRFLEPEDFGLITLAMTAYSVLEMLSDMSTQLALIRHPHPDRKLYDTAWTFGIVRGMAMALLMVATAGPLAGWLGEDRVELLVYFFAFSAALQGFENIGLVSFQRDLQFEKVFNFQVAQKAVAFGIAVPAAIVLRNYWALLISLLGARMFAVAYSYYISAYRPRLSLSSWRELFDFSKWLMVNNIFVVVDSYTPPLMFGRIAGPAFVGVYSAATQIALLPASEIAAPIRRPLYAGYAKLQVDPERLREQVGLDFALLLLVIAPLCVGLGLMAEHITVLGLGRDWLAAVPLIPLCAAFALFDSAGQFTYNLFTLLGRQRLYAVVLGAMIAVRTPIIVWAGITFGPYWAVAAITAGAAVSMVVRLAIALPMVGITAARMFSAVYRSACGCIVMGAVVHFLQVSWPFAEHPLPLLGQAALLTSVGAVVYVMTVYLMWWAAGRPYAAETLAVRFASSALSRIRAKRPVVLGE